MTVRPSSAPSIETERLVLRGWRASDRAPFAALNADPVVMEHFPSTLTARRERRAGRTRIEEHFDEPRLRAVGGRGRRGVADFLGFVGLSIPRFESHFTPCVEIGWRLAREHWGRGYAPEAGRAALRFGFEQLGLDEIVSFTVPANLKSRRVMEKTRHAPRPGRRLRSSVAAGRAPAAPPRALPDEPRGVELRRGV